MFVKTVSIVGNFSLVYPMWFRVLGNYSHVNTWEWERD